MLVDEDRVAVRIGEHEVRGAAPPSGGFIGGGGLVHCPDEEQRQDRQGLPRLAPGGPPRGAHAQIMAVRKVILKNLDTDYEEGMMWGMIGYTVPHR